VIQSPLSLEQLRKQAKELLRACKSGLPEAVQRFAAHGNNGPRYTLADAQFVLAREAGFLTWTHLKRTVANSATRMAVYEAFAQDITDVFRNPGREEQALAGVHRFVGGGHRPDAGQVREHVLQRLGNDTAPESFTLNDARRFVARLYSLDHWRDLEAGGMRGPLYRIRPQWNALEPVPPVAIEQDWDEIIDIMRSRGLPELRALTQMTDAVLRKLAKSGCGEFLTALQMEGSAQVTDAGMKYLAELPRLEKLNITRCNVTDRGMAVLQHLPDLREFCLYHHRGGITDVGLANLAHCTRLERLDLLGSNSGDGVLRALAGKAGKLNHFMSGDLLTDEGLQYLHEFPNYRNWQGGTPRYSLMGFDASPAFLLLRGSLTGRGIANLAGLDGLFALNLDDSRLNFSPADLQPLSQLPKLGWLGLDANDETMAVAGQLPHLRMLMCQDTAAGNAGFRALSESRTLEYIWGRRCYNLGGDGFTLKGLSVSCRNVDDGALATLPDFPALTEFMPMDVPDAGFRHVGRMSKLEELWCMYCRDTTDESTAQLAGLPKLRSYYAGANQITDRSLEILSTIHSLEKIELHACTGVTNSGIAKLATLPKLRRLAVGYIPAVTRTAFAGFPSHIETELDG
jgi:hypothetical protein